jgi:hypothetical protein
MNHTLLRNALLVLAAAMVVRVLAVFLLQSHLGTYVIDAYDVMGKNLLAGHGFSYQAGQTVPTVARAPFYPLWWAGLLEVFGRNFYLLQMAEGFVDAVTAGLAAILIQSTVTTAAVAGTPTHSPRSLTLLRRRGCVARPCTGWPHTQRRCSRRWGTTCSNSGT